MNGVLIIFLVIVIVFAIYMAFQFYDPSYVIRDSTPLKIKNGEQYSISVAELDNPGSARYFYEGWFYIVSNESIDTENVLFNRGKDFVVSLRGSTLNVYKNLSNDVIKSSGIVDLSNEPPLMSLPNFPFQKWCHLVINVDGLSVDLYIDGKFVKNAKSSTVINANITDPITFGNQYTVGNVARFRRMATNINPQSVWNDYMMGSGQTMSVSNYHVNAQLTKNDKVRVDQRII